MSYEARPYNPNRGGITRSGNVSDSYPTDRHPSDTRIDRLLGHAFLLAIAVVVGLVACSVTIWAPIGRAF